MAKKKKQQQDKRKRSWCWYCDREFDEEKILIQHQRMKHFQCHICHRKLNSASGLVIHMAQVHKESMEKVPNAVDGHDSPELEIYGMDGIPMEDLQRYYDGLPIIPYTKSKLIIGDSSILPILAAQKASVAMQLAESKNMTVQGDLVVGVVGSVPISVSGPISPVIPSSSAISVMSPPTNPAPSVILNNSTVDPPSQPNQPYWPYMIPPQYYHQQPPPPTTTNNNNNNNASVPYNQNQYAAAYAQYYQAYYAAQGSQSVNYYGGGTYPQQSQIQETQIQKTSHPSESPKIQETSNTITNPDDPFIIPPHMDPRTNQMIPGTIFTVLSLEKSLEEMRSELKKYKNRL